MKPLVDADILVYELGASSQQVIDGEVVPNSWDFVEELVDKKLALICDEVRATEEPVLFMTNTAKISKSLNRARAWRGEEEIPFRDNFRKEVAQEKVYKGSRAETKPFHYKNLQEYFLGCFNTVVNEKGLEADDQMCIEQYTRVKEGHFDTIICSRDKDLRQCPGNHYSWEVGKQASIGPILVDELGFLEHKNPGERDAKNRLKPPKIFGTGAKFFYYQMLAGDSVDSIGGAKGKGPVFGLQLLHDASSEYECFKRVSEVYQKLYGDGWKVRFREQANLLWMIREVDEEGEKVLWKPPKEAR